MINCDYHIHTQLSGCADNDLRIEKIIEIQQQKDMKVIGITDHDYSYQSKVEKIQAAQQAIKKVDPSIEVFFGVESQMLEYQVTSITIPLASYFDYVLMAPNHYHLRGVARPRSFRDPRRVALHEIYMFEGSNCMSNYGCSRSSISAVSGCFPVYFGGTGCLWSGDDA